MQATLKNRTSIKTGNPAGSTESTAVQLKTRPLFALAQQTAAPLPERFPRLTFLAIALVLLISALTAEFEYLRCAGYSWP